MPFTFNPDDPRDESEQAQAWARSHPYGDEAPTATIANLQGYGAAGQPALSNFMQSQQQPTLSQIQDDESPAPTSGLNLRGPNGETVASSDYIDINTKLGQGWKALKSDGSEYASEPFGGGWLVDGKPVDAILLGTIDPASVKALKDAGKWNPEWNNVLQQQNLEVNGPSIGLPLGHEIYSALAGLRQQYGLPAFTPGAPPTPTPDGPPPVTGDPRTGGDGGPGTGGAGGLTGRGPGDVTGLENLFPTFNTPEIDKITLGELPTVDRYYGPEFDNQYNEYLKAQSAVTGGYYDFDPTAMEAAQIDPTKVPQVTAETPEMFAALEQLLSGKGFDDATMGRMRAMSTDDIARSGAAQRGAARLSAEQAGTAGTPAAQAMEAQSRRQQGDAQNRATQELEVQNAMVGNQNRVTGAGMELNRQSTKAAQANAVALQNAANLLASMSQNTSNLQQRNLVNTQNDVGRQMEQAGTKAKTFDSGSQAYNQSALNRGSQADFWNALQTIGRQSEQAGLDRDKAKFDTGNKMTRYGWDTGNLVNLANMTGANNLYGASNSLSPQTGSTSGWGAALQDLARTLFQPPKQATV